MRRNILRVGDWVRIVKPFAFERCGYPLNKDIVKETMITPSHEEKIREFLKEFGIFKEDSWGNLFRSLTYIDKQDIVFNKIKDAIAYAFLKFKNHGGIERAVYTSYLAQYKGVVGEIVARKTVNSGFYKPAGGYEEDYEPAYLTGQRTHVIFKVAHIKADIYLEPEWFEKIYLEKYV